MPPHGLSAGSRHREGLHPHLPLASRALRPAQRRRIRSMGGRRARIPGQGRRRRHLDRSQSARRPAPASNRAPARRHRAQHLAGDRQVGDRDARRRRRRPRTVSHRTRIRNALPARRLGRRPDDPHLHDEPAPAPARRRSRACDVSRAMLRRQRFRRPSAPVRDASAAGRRREHRGNQAMAAQIRRSSRHRRRRAMHRFRRGHRRRSARSCRHDVRCGDRSSLSRRRSYTRFHQQGVRGARSRGMGSRRTRARQSRAWLRDRRSNGGSQRVAQSHRSSRASRSCIRDNSGVACSRETREPLLERSRRACAGDPRRRSGCYHRRDACRLTRRMRARGSRRRCCVCCVTSNRTLPNHQRVWRLGYRPSQLYVCQRRSPIRAPSRFAGVGARNF